jgi:aryl-alcohol dehydrogenase-like predicted oxidoreductase
LIPWAPLAGGLLGGVLSGVSEEGRRSTSKNVQTALNKYKEQVKLYESFCKELGQEPGVIALAWLLQNPAITSPITGPRTMEQLTSCLSALDIMLSEETLNKLDEIWPGPGNQAPEAYAW